MGMILFLIASYGSLNRSSREIGQNGLTGGTLFEQLAQLGPKSKNLWANQSPTRLSSPGFVH